MLLHAQSTTKSMLQPLADYTSDCCYTIYYIIGFVLFLLHKMFSIVEYGVDGYELPRHELELR